ncbi:MAG TPA: hypothetical protein VGQ62_23225, partial [Chloroflexota bacterium]|nr:hypothetical protein [Chloroflexota bacterium]
APGAVALCAVASTRGGVVAAGGAAGEHALSATLTTVATVIFAARTPWRSGRPHRDARAEAPITLRAPSIHIARST